MNPRTLRAVVLSAYDTGETSEVVHVLTGELGRLSIYAKGLRAPRSRFAGVLQPLSEVEVTLHLRDGHDLGTLREATLLDAHPALTSDLERLTLALLVADAAAAGAEPGHPCEDAFEVFMRGLALLEPASQAPPLEAAALALSELLHVQGYAPALDESATRPCPPGTPRPACFWLSVESALIHLRGRQPATPPDWPIPRPRASADFPLPPVAVRFLHNLSTGATPPRLPHGEALQLLEALVRLAEHHHEAPLRANRVWRDITGQPATA